MINTYESEHDEIMHGIGVHHSSHNIPPFQSIGGNSSNAAKGSVKTSESVSLGGCTMANKYTKRQSDVSIMGFGNIFSIFIFKIY